MFDEQNQNSAVPKNLPTEPVDMFAGVEKDIPQQRDPASQRENPPPAAAPDAVSAGLLKKKEQVTAAPNLPPINQGVNLQNYKTSAPVLGKVLLFLIVILLLGGLAYGAWWLFYGSKIKSAALPATTDQASQNQTSQTSGANNTANTSTNVPAQQNNDQILFGQAVDSDKDGLDDVREKEIGTDPQKADTDGDGLSDGDEVIVYKTSPLISDSDGDGLSDGDEVLIWHSNPLNPDTDGDGYPDGTEVRNGYSPLGPGKLFNSASSTASGSTTPTP